MEQDDSEEEEEDEDEEEEEEDEEDDSEVEKTQSKKSKMAAAVGNRGKVEKAIPPKRSKLEEVSVGTCVITCMMSKVWSAK